MLSIQALKIYQKESTWKAIVASRVVVTATLTREGEEVASAVGSDERELVQGTAIAFTSKEEWREFVTTSVGTAIAQAITAPSPLIVQMLTQ